MDISYDENEVTNYESSIDKNDFIEETNSSEIFLNKFINFGCENVPRSIDECNNSSLFESQDNDNFEIPDLYSEVEFIISHFDMMEKNNLYNLNLDENDCENELTKNAHLKELKEDLIKNKNNKKKYKKIKKEILKNKSLIKQLIIEQKKKLNAKNDQQYNVMNIKRNRVFF
jgi:hypothetical protein